MTTTRKKNLPNFRARIQLWFRGAPDPSHPTPPHPAKPRFPLTLSRVRKEMDPHPPGSSPSHPPASVNRLVPVAVATPRMARIPNFLRTRGVLGTQTSSEVHYSTVSYDSPISKLPPEVLIAIFELVAPAKTREDLYTLLSLTHVCRDWRRWLIGHTQAWATIFAMRQDRRSFVETCLERSQDQPLEVTVDINDKLWVPDGCSCKKTIYGNLLPNDESPCQWHFLFELLAQPSVSERIKVLQISSSSQVLTPPSISRPRFKTWWIDPPMSPTYSRFSPSVHSWSPFLELEKCQFFLTTFPQLTTLVWKDEATKYAHLLFSAPRSLPEVKSLTFEGRWHESLSLCQVNNLTSFTIKKYLYILTTEDFRLFLSNNLSLISLDVSTVIRGEAEGDPIVLSNLKSLTVDCDSEALSTILNVPAFQRFSTLHISLEDGRDDIYILHATEGDISLVAKAKALKVQEDWQHLTGYAKPTIRHVSLYDQHIERIPPRDSCTEITALMTDAHTVDFGLTYSVGWDNRLWDKLKLLGDLKVIRFEVLEEMNPYGEGRGPDEDFSDLDLFWDRIADLVEHRFGNGRALHTVERMVVSEDVEVGRRRDVLWKRFFEDRSIQNYLAPRKVTTDEPSM